MNTEYIGVPEKTGVFSVVGCDTFYGARMRKHLCEAGKAVYGLGRQRSSIRQWLSGLKDTAQAAADI